MSEFFIPRKTEMDILREGFFRTEPGNAKCFALIGPNHIGKSMLVEKLADEFEEKEHPKVFYIPYSIKDVKEVDGVDSNYTRFWMNLALEFMDRVSCEELKYVSEIADDKKDKFVKDIQEIYDFLNPDTETRTIALSHLNVSRKVRRLFELYTNLGVQILLSLDEFDEAISQFPHILNHKNDAAKCFFTDLYSLSGKSKKKLNLSILLIGRRRIGSVQHSMAVGSDLEQAYKTIILRGFNNEELAQYRSSFDCALSDEMFRAIIYYCGRHPGMLDYMRENVETVYGKEQSAPEKKSLRQMVDEMLANNAESNTEMADPDSDKADEYGKIVRLYHELGEDIKTTYKTMVRLMETERLDIVKVNCVSTFMQEFMGPRYDEEAYHKDNLEKLHSFGFLTGIGVDVNGKKTESVYDFLDERTASGVARQSKYDPIAPHFVAYMAEHAVKGRELDLVAMQLKIHEEVRSLIADIYKKRYPAVPGDAGSVDSWKNQLWNKIATDKKYERFNESLEEKAAENDAAERGVEYSILNVVNFTLLGEMVCEEWDDLGKYFYPLTQEQLKEHFRDDLKDSRDCVFHGSYKVLTPKEAERLAGICEDILNKIEYGKNLPEGAELLPMPDAEDSGQNESVSGEADGNTLTVHNAPAQIGPRSSYDIPRDFQISKILGRPEQKLSNLKIENDCLEGSIDFSRQNGSVLHFKARMDEEHTNELRLGRSLPFWLDITVIEYVEDAQGGYFNCRGRNVRSRH